MSVKEQMQSGDWSGMTAKEIAEELGCSVDTVYGALKQIKEETGKEVPYKKMRQKTEVNAGERNVSLKEALLADDWSDLTPTEIAETLGVNTTEVYKALYRLKKTGREVPYKKQSRGRPKKVAKAEAERASEEPPAHEENHAEDGDGERANNVRPYGETETHPSEEPPAHEENHAEDGDG
ncbi:MAG: HTH domain-containing protein, partial [Clostridiales bacterium]|nr:HTH domain-containing protein [Clostridiales bacterium]